MLRASHFDLLCVLDGPSGPASSEDHESSESESGRRQVKKVLVCAGTGRTCPAAACSGARPCCDGMVAWCAVKGNLLIRSGAPPAVQYLTPWSHHVAALSVARVSVCLYFGLVQVYYATVQCHR